MAFQNVSRRPRAEALGLGLAFAGVAIFAATLPMTRLAVGPLGAWFLTAGRAAGAGVLALFVLAALRRPWPSPGDAKRIAVIALCLVAGFPGFTGLAMVSVPAAHGAVVVGLLPLSTVLAAALLGHERPSPAFWLCAAFGAALVLAFMLRANAGGLAPGDLLLIAAVAAAALGYAVSGRLSQRMPGWEVISWAVVFSLPATAPAALLLWPADSAAVPAAAWLGFVYLAVMSMYFGFFAWNAGMALAGVARASQVQLLQPFLSIALAAVVNGEALGWETIGFAGAIVATIIVSRRFRVGRREIAAKP